MAIERIIISDAVKEEINTWRISAVGAVNNTSLPPLPGDDPLLKSAAWLNFGLDAGKNLSLAAGTAISKAAVPIWITFKAQELYKKYYVDQQNAIDYALLNDNYDGFQSQVIDSINNAKANFLTQPKTKSMIAQIEQLFQNNTTTVKLGSNEKEKEVRRLLLEANVIETSDATIKKVIRGNLKVVADNIHALYSGTHRAGGNNLLYIADDVRSGMPLLKVQSARSSRVYSSNTAYQRASSASCSGPQVDRVTPKGYSQVDTKDKLSMKKLYSRAHLMDIKHKDYTWLDPCMDTTRIEKLPQTDTSRISQINDSARGVGMSIHEAYKKLYG